MDGTKPISLSDKMAINVGLDPNKVEKPKFEGVDFRNIGREAFLAGGYDKAANYYKKSIKITKTQDPKDSSLIPTSIGLCESYIRLKDWQQAKIIADSLMSIAKKNQHQEAIRVTVELLDEIEQGKNGQTCDKQEKIKPFCSSCKKPDAKFHCSLCKRDNYCSKECQSKDWANHKEICHVMSSPRPTCGLCGFQGSRWILITKTPCCDQWICDDEHTCELSSDKLNSCMKNHSLYKCREHLGKNASSGEPVSYEKYDSTGTQRSQQEIESDEFCDKHFDFKNVTDIERQRNREMKKDENSANVFMVKCTEFCDFARQENVNTLDNTTYIPKDKLEKLFKRFPLTEHNLADLVSSNEKTSKALFDALDFDVSERACLLMIIGSYLDRKGKREAATIAKTSQSPTIPAPVATNQDVSVLVYLNLSGTPFTVFRDTLEKSSFFSRLLSKPESLTRDKNGAIFIERSPRMFHYVIDYLASYNMWFYDALSSEDKLQFTSDAQFYGLSMPVELFIRVKEVISTQSLYSESRGSESVTSLEECPQAKVTRMQSAVKTLSSNLLAFGQDLENLKSEACYSKGITGNKKNE